MLRLLDNFVGSNLANVPGDAMTRQDTAAEHESPFNKDRADTPGAIARAVVATRVVKYIIQY